VIHAARKLLNQESIMLTDLSPETLLITLMTTIAIREFLIIVLPSSLAGPDGWLIRAKD